MTRALALAVVCALAACGSSPLSARDEALWAPGPPLRGRIPVLVYRDVDASFERQMALLARAGFRTVTLQQLVRFVGRKPVDLPARPFLLTFDGARRALPGADAVLRERNFNAVLFVDVEPVENGDRDRLSWEELDRLDRRRWDVQLQSGTGNRRIRYGPDPGDVGAFYAYRGAEEVLGGWRERVFSDVSYGEEQLTAHIRGYTPLAIAPPFGNYGQAGTNDPRIPRLLRARLLLSFRLVFAKGGDPVAMPGASIPLGRFAVSADTDERELHRFVTGAPGHR